MCSVSVYSRLQYFNKMYLDSRLGHTLSCLVAEKKLNSQLIYFYTTPTKPSYQAKTEVKEVMEGGGRLRRDM